jgi:DNA-binding response OmpR family regulator
VERILVIDDDRQFLAMVQSLLSDEGYETASSTNAREGMELLARFEPDVLLLDWQMPELTGIEIIRSIRASKQFGDLFIIMLSGKIMTDNIVTAIKAGADDYVIKPFSPEELMARVFNGVRSRKRRAVAGENRQRILKGLQKIETVSQQLASAVAKDKRSAASAALIKESASELKDLLDSSQM